MHRVAGVRLFAAYPTEDSDEAYDGGGAGRRCGLHVDKDDRVLAGCGRGSGRSARRADARRSARPGAGRGPAAPAPQGPNPDSHYQLGPDSLPQDGVPKGEIRGPFTLPSQAYPGTQHTYWVYVPAQYDPAVAGEPDDLQRRPGVQEHGRGRPRAERDGQPDLPARDSGDDRRVHQPGPHARSARADAAGTGATATTNRPTEYNTLDDKYARVIVDELMPALNKDYNISKDPERHGIGGASSGAIAAFTVAWERPERVPQGPQHRRQLHQPARRPRLRRHRAGRARRSRSASSCRTAATTTAASAATATYDETRDWFFQNVRLMQALTEKGYDVNYTWGIGKHGQKQGGAILPDMMRWLWRDHPVSTDRERHGRALVQRARVEKVSARSALRRSDACAARVN